MRKPYTPKPGGYIAKTLDLLDASCLSTAELGVGLGIDSADVRAYMLTAVKHGLLHFVRDGRSGVWMLGAAADAETQDADVSDDSEADAAGEEDGESDGDGQPDQEPFLVSLHSDGELTMRGMHVDHTGGVLLSKAQALVLANFVHYGQAFLVANAAESAAA